MFGVARQKLEFITHKKKNKIQEQSVFSSFVIQKNQKGNRYYYPNHSTRIVETGNARFIENGELSGSEEPRKVEIKEVRVRVSLPFTSFKDVVPNVVVQPKNQQEQQIDTLANLNEVIINEPALDVPQEVALRKSQKQELYYF